MTPDGETWEIWSTSASYNLSTRRGNGATDVKRFVEFKTVYPQSPSGSGASLALDGTITGKRLASLQPRLFNSRFWKDHPGKRIGRPRVSERPDFELRFTAVVGRIGPGGIPRRRAAGQMGIGYDTLKRLVDSRGRS